MRFARRDGIRNKFQSSRFGCNAIRLSLDYSANSSMSGPPVLTMGADVSSAVESARGEKWEAFSRRYGDEGTPMVMWLARRYTGMTLREIGHELNGRDYVAVYMASSALDRYAFIASTRERRKSG